jgi:hypothetical protein
MGESVSLVGTDSPRWQDVADWLPLALDQLGQRDLVIRAVEPPPTYSEDMTEALGHTSPLQRYASEVSSREGMAFPHLSKLTGRPAFYLPVEFPEPLLALKGRTLLTRLFPTRLFVGSSVQLLAELESLAPLLHISKDAGEVGMAAFERVTEKGEFPAERYTWGVLRWFCRMSVERHAVVHLA